MQLRIGIIGAGGRVMDTILPAIWALGNKAKLLQINTQSSRPVNLPDGSSIITKDEISSISLKDYDVIIIAVGTSNIRSVLDELSRKKHRDSVTLVMDTPPLRLSDYWKTNLFSGYKGVAVGEDWITLSPILAMKNIINSGRIGDLRHIQFDHMSYRYHGLAALKLLASVKTVSSMRRVPMGNNFYETRVTLKQNVTATAIEPRDYVNGRIRITGTKGTISDYAICTNKKSDFQFGYVDTKKGWYQPFSINGEIQPMDEVETYMASLPYNTLHDGSRINRFKIRAYARLLEDIARGFANYPIWDGLYDYLATAVAEKSGHFKDISLSNNQNSLVRRLIKRGK